MLLLMSEPLPYRQAVNFEMCIAQSNLSISIVGSNMKLQSDFKNGFEKKLA